MSSSNFTYLISDLHLTPERPAVTEHFLSFLAGAAKQATELYILGDLFEYWIGDDAAAMLGAEPVLNAMSDVANDIPCYFIAGNRDFLVGQTFSQQSGFKILDDETVVNLYGQDTLLLHGDSLCTDDVAHQQFRASMVTNHAWRTQFLSLDIPARIEQAMQARMQSHAHKTQISMTIMDVSQSSVMSAFEKYNVRQMIHGHTHRQNQHDYEAEGVQYCRHVLGDWESSSSIMKVSANGITIENQAIG